MFFTLGDLMPLGGFIKQRGYLGRLAVYLNYFFSVELNLILMIVGMNDMRAKGYRVTAFA